MRHFKFKFQPSQFRLGLRTLKTGIAVFLVLLLFTLMGWKGLQIGTLTAAFSLREDMDKSMHFGASRIFGNTVGGVLSLIFFGANHIFHYNILVTLILVPILTMLTIMINVACQNKTGIIGGVAALLIICLSIPHGEQITYVFARIFETFVGVFIAILVNSDADRLRDAFKRHYAKISKH